MIFAIETSCDETSTSIIDLKGKILSHIIAKQEIHQDYGGVVPEIASRAHTQILQKIIPKTFTNDARRPSKNGSGKQLQKNTSKIGKIF